MAQGPDLTELFRLAMSGDTASRDQLLRFEERRIRSYSYSRLAGLPDRRGLTECVTQETLLAIALAIEKRTLSDLQHLRAYACVVVRNQCASIFRDPDHHFPTFKSLDAHDTNRDDSDAFVIDEILAATGTSPSSAAARKERFEIIFEELEKIEANQREALKLYYLAGVATTTMEERLDIRRTAAAERIHRGRDELKRRLRRRGLGSDDGLEAEA